MNLTDFEALAADLRAMVEDQWEKQSGLPLEERNLTLKGSPIAGAVREAGEAADAFAGLEGMQGLLMLAFYDPKGKGPYNDCCRVAFTELNYAWSGIGEWQS